MKFNDDINSPETGLQLLEREAEKSKAVPPLVSETPPLFFSKRLLVTILLFFSFVNFQILKNNMNIAVVDMSSNKSIVQDNSTVVQLPEFDWDSATVGIVTSIVNYGGLLSFVNGFVINKFGSSTTCVTCMLLAGVATALHPLILRHSFYAFLAWRFLTGALEVAFYASTAEIQSRWFPIKERSILIAFSFNGTNVGVAIVYPFGGYLARKWGWPMVFYVTGAESIIMAVLFLILVKNSPTHDKNISKAELAYILQDNTVDFSKKEPRKEGTKPNKIIDALKPILTSAPIWAFFFFMLTFMWIATVISACLPLFVKDLTGKESDEVGYISSIPNTVFIFMFPVAGAILDFWKNHSDTTTTRIHKIMASFAYTTVAVFFTAITFVSHLTTFLAFFVLIQICMSFVALIISLMMINLAPNHVSHVVSLSTNFACLGAIAAQTGTGLMTTNHNLQEWNRYFLMTAAIAVIGNVIVVIFGSSDPQPWSLPSVAKEEGILIGEKSRTERNIQ